MIPGMNETYDISSETEVDKILTDVPFTMMIDLVRAQIDDPTSTKVNYIETVIDKFRALEDQYEDDVDTLQEIKSLIVEFFSKIISQISEKVGFDVDVDMSSVGTVEEVGTVLYYFFILRYVKNMRRFMYKFINKNKKHLAAEFEPSEKKKDVTTIRLKKMTSLKGKEDILIISELNTIIRAILDTYEFSNEEFLQYACSSSTHEGWKMNELLETGVISNSFVQSYFHLILEDDACIDKIQNHVQNKMIENNSK